MRKRMLVSRIRTTVYADAGFRKSGKSRFSNNDDNLVTLRGRSLAEGLQNFHGLECYQRDAEKFLGHA